MFEREPRLDVLTEFFWEDMAKRGLGIQLEPQRTMTLARFKVKEATCARDLLNHAQTSIKDLELMFLVTAVPRRVQGWSIQHELDLQKSETWTTIVI